VQSAASSLHISEIAAFIGDDTLKAVKAMKQVAAEVKDGMEAVRLAGESFVAIQAAVDKVAGQIGEVAEAVGQISNGTKKTSVAMEGISEVATFSAVGTQQVAATTEEQLASMEEITSSSIHLASMAGQVQDMIRRFKV
jgi:methyl-accepting chemotaxis protein